VEGDSLNELTGWLFAMSSDLTESLIFSYLPLPRLARVPVLTCLDRQGCLGMQVGEVRKLDIPAEEGYGAGGFPAWGIPPGGGLLFELECLEIA
jgi:hypothetical protein